MASTSSFNPSASSAAAPWLARYHGWLLAALWVGMQVICWNYYRGPNLFGDGKSYFAYAEQIAQTNRFAGGYYLHYAGFSAFMSLFIKLGLGLLSIGLAQVGVSGLAMGAFYRTAWRLSGQHWPTAALATAVLICWFEVQAFNAFILTESLFTSFLLFSLWAVARIRNLRDAALALILLLLTVFMRPNGFIALGAGLAAGLCWLHQAGWPGRTRWLGLLLLVLLPLGWPLANWLLGVLDLMTDYAAGTVIFHYNPSALPIPASLRMPSSEASKFGQLLWFISHNFHYFSQLAALRLTYFLGFPKPWHSPRHIAWLATTLPAIYWLAARGAGNSVAALPVRTYLAVCLLLQMSIVMLTFEDWDVRFSGPMIPYWLMLAALGAQPWLRRRFWGSLHAR